MMREYRGRSAGATARLALVLGVLAGSGVAACSSGSDAAGDASPAKASAADLIGKSAWCVQHGCSPSATISMDSGKVNHPFTMPPSEYAMVEVQTRDTLVVGAGLMLWRDKHSADSATQQSLTSFAKSVVGDCAAASAHVQSKYADSATAVMAAPAVQCGPWSVRTGVLSAGYFVSIDRTK